MHWHMRMLRTGTDKTSGRLTARIARFSPPASALDGAIDEALLKPRSCTRVMRQNDPCQEGGRAQRGTSRCLIRLRARTRVIDRSDTAWPGSDPDTAAEGTVGLTAVSGPGPARSAVGSRLDRAIWRAGEALRRHWVLALLIAAGLVLRVVTQFAYQPALLFFDSKKYLFGTDFRVGAWGSYDPIGYTLLVLKPVLLVGDLGVVALLQHVLGLGMAVALYVLMLRRGVTRWLAALAAAARAAGRSRPPAAPRTARPA